MRIDNAVLGLALAGFAMLGLAAGCVDGDDLRGGLRGEAQPEAGGAGGQSDAAHGDLDAGRGGAGGLHDGGPTADAQAADARACGAEICNGADDDCDGQIDEDADLPCGPAEAGVGRCVLGQRRCVAGFLRECVGAVGPAGEFCDSVDNDCDGRTDESLECGCEPGESQVCFSGLPEQARRGRCRPGTQTCDPQSARFGPCEAEVAPIDEICNGADDDCDGTADEALVDPSATCMVGLGACARVGEVVCTLDGLGCDGVPGDPQNEICNGRDDDCDGRVDEAFDVGVECVEGLGACALRGVLVCGPNGGLICDGEGNLPMLEDVCNAIDDDCDGEVDEATACYLGPAGTANVGACRAGVEVCRQGCMGAVLPNDERCNGADDDCDGAADEDAGCDCDPGETAPCFEGAGMPGVGICRDGARTCQADHSWGACAGVVNAQADACNGLDDDCDARIDEDVTNRCGECGAEPVEACNGADDDCDGRTDEGTTNSCGECGPLPNEACNGADDDCDGRIDEGVLNECGECGRVSREICNGNDDDCDGRVDERVQNACGECGGVPVEVCDGIDNDCDNSLDEGLLNACGECGPVPVEVCDGIDNDCDNSLDEGLLNACGECGAVPSEVCNGRDDDCDGDIDERVLNACGECGAVPAEVCNNVDDDCDRAVDEGGDAACSSLHGPRANRCDGGQCGCGLDDVCSGGAICDSNFCCGGMSGRACR